MVRLGRTGLEVFPVCLGGNAFGWTADEPASRAVPDGYADAGGNFIDTSNSYLVEHGRSETIIGRWMADRGNRNQIVVATKVGGVRGPVRNLRPETIEREAHASLERLQTDRIDLYYPHFDDPGTPLEESLVWAVLFDALFAWEGLALSHLSGVVPTLSDTFRVIMRYPAGRWALFALCPWFGWHIFIRGWHLLLRA
jgi:aryl-alcohol dehydrogenase-like predicted oxidoreductase